MYSLNRTHDHRFTEPHVCSCVKRNFISRTRKMLQHVLVEHFKCATIPEVFPQAAGQAVLLCLSNTLKTAHVTNERVLTACICTIAYYVIQCLLATTLCYCRFGSTFDDAFRLLQISGFQKMFLAFGLIFWHILYLYCPVHVA